MFITHGILSSLLSFYRFPLIHQWFNQSLIITIDILSSHISFYRFLSIHQRFWFRLNFLNVCAFLIYSVFVLFLNSWLASFEMPLEVGFASEFMTVGARKLFFTILLARMFFINMASETCLWTVCASTEGAQLFLLLCSFGFPEINLCLFLLKLCCLLLDCCSLLYDLLFECLDFIIVIWNHIDDDILAWCGAVDAVLTCHVAGKVKSWLVDVCIVWWCFIAGKRSCFWEKIFLFFHVTAKANVVEKIINCGEVLAWCVAYDAVLACYVAGKVKSWLVAVCIVWWCFITGKRSCFWVKIFLVFHVIAKANVIEKIINWMSGKWVHDLRSSKILCDLV